MERNYESKTVKQVKIARDSIKGVQLPKTPSPEKKIERFRFLKQSSLSK